MRGIKKPDYNMIYNLTKEDIRKALEYDLTSEERDIADFYNCNPHFKGVTFSCWQDDLEGYGYFKIWWDGGEKMFKYTDIFESEETKEDYQIVANFLNAYLNRETKK